MQKSFYKNLAKFIFISLIALSSQTCVCMEKKQPSSALKNIAKKVLLLLLANGAKGFYPECPTGYDYNRHNSICTKDPSGWEIEILCFHPRCFFPVVRDGFVPGDHPDCCKSPQRPSYSIVSNILSKTFSFFKNTATETIKVNCPQDTDFYNNNDTDLLKNDSNLKTIICAVAGVVIVIIVGVTAFYLIYNISSKKINQNRRSRRKSETVEIEEIETGTITVSDDSSTSDSYA